MREVLNVCGLRKYYADGDTHEKKIVVDDVNFFVREGECLGIVGRSGCGKSTTVRMVARLVSADGGKILFCGKDITHAVGRELRDVYRAMQMIFQMPGDSFNPRKTLGWSIAEPLKNSGATKEQAAEAVAALLEEVGLAGKYAARYPHEVSGGECQRAAIARAIALSPKLLICDEATSALDVTVQVRVVNLISRLCKEKKIACLFITHDLALLPSIADRVAVMCDGKIVEEGAVGEVLCNAKTSCTRELLAASFLWKM